MSQERDISPLGMSRFERPYTPPTHRTSPTSTQSAATQHFGSSTSATSFAEEDREHPHTPATSQGTGSFDAHRYGDNPDDWFADFRGDLDISDECPGRAQLAAVNNIPIFDQNGQPRPFGSLYDPNDATHQRQLVVFIRHFYCGACQAYLKALTESITMQEYFSIPIPTSIIVIGCGQPHLIPHYRKFTNCPFPIFSEPTRRLYKKLGMSISLNIGSHRPEYMKDISAIQWLNGQVKTIAQSVRDPEGIRKRDIVRGGNSMQIGGEFLFEDGDVIWCHRMKNYRNHAEIKVIRQVLELDE